MYVYLNFPYQLVKFSFLASNTAGKGLFTIQYTRHVQVTPVCHAHVPWPTVFVPITRVLQRAL